jgi:hypothetical protein
MHTTFWLENLKGRDYLEDLGIDRKIILELIPGKEDGCGLNASTATGSHMNLWAPQRWRESGLMD